MRFRALDQPPSSGPGGILVGDQSRTCSRANLRPGHWHRLRGRREVAQACELLLRAPGAALVVNSDHDIAATIAAALRDCGWHVQAMRTIAEARLELPTLKPCIVLLDMWQSDGSGIAFVRELAGRADVGIIVVSAFNDLADRVVGLELGADGYITKPFSLRELTARVRTLDRRMAKQGA